MIKKVVFITNMPVPYREKIHEEVFSILNGRYHVIYAHQKEPDRKWTVPDGAYSKSFLKPAMLKFRGRFIHFNLDVWTLLNFLNPSIVITGGFNPTYLIAFLWCRLKGRKHVPFSDGWLKSEKKLTFLHVLVRKWVYRGSTAFLGASRHSLDLYRHYRCPEGALFQSALCADNQAYFQVNNIEKKYDLLFSGQLIQRKMPLFFAEVALLVHKEWPGLRILILGDGPEKAAMELKLKSVDLKYFFAGFRSQEELPLLYASAKLFLFPTLQEPWGVVANEASAAGVPTLTCSNAGAAGDLIIHGENGFVLPLDAQIWADHALQLLRNQELFRAFQIQARKRVEDFSYGNAAKGIVRAVEYCTIPPDHLGPDLQ